MNNDNEYLIFYIFLLNVNFILFFEIFYINFYKIKNLNFIRCN